MYYKRSPDNRVSISSVPGLTRIFWKEIAQIPRSNTVFIRKSHFLPPETQINQPINFVRLWYLIEIIGLQYTLIDLVSIT
jgi:hypothetical protein